jgi:hypothetical protein
MGPHLIAGKISGILSYVGAASTRRRSDGATLSVMVTKAASSGCDLVEKAPSRLRLCVIFKPATGAPRANWVSDSSGTRCHIPVAKGRTGLSETSVGP